jgi:predicted methyltransferase
VKCDKCGGSGVVENPKYWNAKNRYPNSDYYLQFDTSITCKKCNGSGYIIGKIKDVLQLLSHLKTKFENNPEYKREIQQCIDLIEQ